MYLISCARGGFGQSTFCIRNRLPWQTRYDISKANEWGFPKSTANHGVPVLETINRKSFRPPLAEPKERSGPPSRSAAVAPKKQAPPDQTNAENFYYVKQMQTKTPMVIVLKDGEQVHGVIEWYDKTCIKVNRDEGPNLLIYKSYIKYLYKEG